MMEEAQATDEVEPKKHSKWGTAPYRYNSPPWHAFKSLIQNVKYNLSYFYSSIIYVFFGVKSCRGCWHSGRVMGMKACFHPQGIVSCLLYTPSDDYTSPGKLFLQRPPFLFRLKHRKTWRKELRLAAMKLSPQEPVPHTFPQNVSNQLSAVTSAAMSAGGSGYASPPLITITKPSKGQVGVPPGPSIITQAPTQAAQPQGRKP